ncbi:MAG: peptidoglycan bridge formation glycyltransferase FemA/FemB family protein [Candidatus Doudnabacteria bacterium]|nr:peptidoglycan bridge formation glycyltransferase FemA/FemB family protein [Candidatus Doudnabacteria bacterium]
MKLIELSENQKFEYNHFVATAESGSFLQSWEWGSWQEQLGRQVYRFFVKDDGGQIIASLQSVKMPLPLGKYYLYAPYGPVVNDKFPISNFQSISNEIIFKFPDAVFIRVEPTTWNMEHGTWNIKKTMNIQPAKTLIIDLLKSEEQLLQEMHSKTRYNIKVAQKHEVEIKDEFNISIGHGLYVKEAVRLIAETAARQGFRGHGVSYYEKMVDYLGIQNRGDLRLHIYKVIYNQQLLASAIMLDFGKTRTFLFGGSSRENKNVMAPYLMHFQAMLDAKASGLLQYDFWGVETSRREVSGFVRFKLGFGGQVQEYLGAFDIIKKRFLYGIYKVFRYIHRLL